MRTRQAVGILMLLLGCQPLAAQEWPGVFPGAEVRVVSPAYSGTATVARTDADALELMVPGLAALVSIPIHSVDRLEVRVRRTRSEGALRRAPWGLLAGAAAGAFGDPPQEEDGFWNTSTGVIVGMAIFGAGTGALIGAAWPGERWARVAPPGSVSIIPGPHGGFTVGGTLVLVR